MTNGTAELFCKEEKFIYCQIKCRQYLAGESLSSYTVAFLNSQTLGIITNIWNIIEG